MKPVDPSKLYPYLTPPEYPETPGITRLLGHDVSIQLVEDLSGMCKNVTMDELKMGAISADQAHARALQNLQSLTEQSMIPAELYFAPDKTPFVVWHSHWLAATCLLLPRLSEWASRHLQTAKICASIPHRETLLLFPEKDRAFRDQMREMIHENESDAPKPITWELFSVSPGGVQPFREL